MNPVAVLPFFLDEAVTITRGPFTSAGEGAIHVHGRKHECGIVQQSPSCLIASPGIA